MKIYRINYYHRRRQQDRVSWARTQSDAKQSYKELVAEHDEHNVEKPEAVDFPTTHQGVVDWLNLHATEGPE